MRVKKCAQEVPFDSTWYIKIHINVGFIWNNFLVQGMSISIQNFRLAPQRHLPNKPNLLNHAL